MRDLLRRSATVALATIAGLALAACSSSDEQAGPVDAASTSDAPTALASIDVTVNYTGTRHGGLVVGAFHSVPPMGPPLAFQTAAMAAFPAHVTLRDLEPGTVYIIGVLDVAPASPTMPGMEDLQTASGPVMLTGSDTSLSLTLADP